ncbi:MAG: hypothetical protein F4X56_08785 [Gammaproteobacteria bacterium]|nr:hypothetical protein [Gammaproteobacteria bacterium]
MTNQQTQKFLLAMLLFFLGCGGAFAYPESAYYDPELIENEYYAIYGETSKWDGTETVAFVRRDVNPISGEEFASYGFVHLNEDLNMSLKIRHNKTKKYAKMILSSGKKYSQFPDNTVNVVYQFDNGTIVDTQGKILGGASRYIELRLSDERLDSMVSLMEKSKKFVFRIDGEEFTLNIAGLNQGSNSILGGKASDDFRYLIDKIDADALNENRRVLAEWSEDEWEQLLLAIQEKETIAQIGENKYFIPRYSNGKIFETKPVTN